MADVSLFLLAPYPEGVRPGFDAGTAASAYKDVMDTVRACDRSDIRAVYFSEHHFGGFSLTPSPHLMVAAMAPQTTKVRLGVLVSPTSMHEPWRLAEETAMLDYLTGGRLDVGIGSGLAGEASKIGVKPAQRQSRFRDGADLVLRYWLTDAVPGNETYPAEQPLDVFPKPLQRPFPPVWVPCFDHDDVIWAGERGFNLVISQPGPAAARSLLLDARESLDNYQALRTAVRVRVVIEQNHHATGRARLPDDLVAGTAAQVSEQLQHIAAATRCTDLLLWADFSGNPVRTRVTTEAILDKVLPTLVNG